VGGKGHSRRRQTASAVKESADVGEEVAHPLARSSYPHESLQVTASWAWEIGPAFNWSWKSLWPSLRVRSPWTHLLR
jgi:hypothetical protein